MKLRIRIIIRIFRKDFPKDLVTLRQKTTDFTSPLTVRATGFFVSAPRRRPAMFCICSHA